jgi:hypothetical protein
MSISENIQFRQTALTHADLFNSVTQGVESLIGVLQDAALKLAKGSGKVTVDGNEYDLSTLSGASGFGIAVNLLSTRLSTVTEALDMVKKLESRLGNFS